MHQPWTAPAQPSRRGPRFGPLELVTAPAFAAVSVAEAKLHCRVDADDDDDLIERLVEAATEHLQELVQGCRQFRQATFDLPLGGWWDCLRLPRPPLQGVTWVKYRDVAGVLQTADAALYEVRTPLQQPGWIERAPDMSWPALQADRLYPVTVRFGAGHETADAVPAAVKQTILLLVGHWYWHRETSLTGAVSKELEFAVTSLLQTQGWGSYA